MNYRNPQFNSFGTIDCEVEHPVHGWIPFTADPVDPEPHGRDIYAQALAANPAPYAAPTPAAPSTSDIRADRDRRLAASDWTQVADAPVDQAAWAAYRQALRDVPEQPGFPASVVWPTPPA